MPCFRNWNLCSEFWQNVFNISSDIRFVVVDVIQFRFNSFPLHIRPILLALGLIMKTIRIMFWFFEQSAQLTRSIRVFVVRRYHLKEETAYVIITNSNQT